MKIFNVIVRVEASSHADALGAVGNAIGQLLPDSFQGQIINVKEKRKPYSKRKKYQIYCNDELYSTYKYSKKRAKYLLKACDDYKSKWEIKEV